MRVVRQEGPWPLGDSPDYFPVISSSHYGSIRSHLRIRTGGRSADGDCLFGAGHQGREEVSSPPRSDGTGKTFTMANVIREGQQPTLVISHNKTLAAQLYGEFREFFPDNSVHYFVSYYDYYQPEAYIPQRDIYIEKDSSSTRHGPPPLWPRPTSSRARPCDRGRQRVVHLRLGLARGYTIDDGCPTERGKRSTAMTCSAAWSTFTTIATTWRSRGASSASVGMCRGLAGVRGIRLSDRVVGRRDREAVFH